MCTCKHYIYSLSLVLKWLFFYNFQPPICDANGENLLKKRRKRQTLELDENRGLLYDTDREDLKVKVYRGLYVSEASDFDDAFIDEESPTEVVSKFAILYTIPMPKKDAASIQKIFISALHNDAFHLIWRLIFGCFFWPTYLPTPVWLCPIFATLPNFWPPVIEDLPPTSPSSKNANYTRFTNCLRKMHELYQNSHTAEHAVFSGSHD